MTSFILFLCILGFFHLSEFFLVYRYNRRELGWHSFLISKDYCLAMLLSVVEYWLEVWYAPWLKRLSWTTYAGVMLVILGEFIRKAAMITAGQNFTHLIATFKYKQHILVTRGIYRYVRHPGYLGWFIWSISTQVVLANPICLIIFSIVSWRFFATRIPFEEHYLTSFFGEQYRKYKSQTPTYLPFIH
mmetsp:Transcript_6596/g.10271  ORF Transcript_6596/g.10271 Transcript_6596/m.10271 type:complete len:188 (-) Transcript_6596:933-1496(-)